MLEKRHLRRRYNVYWVRVKVPDKVRHVIGKRELQRNLFTTSLIEANKRKHKVVAEFKEMIHHAEMRISGEYHELSKEDQIRQVALEYRKLDENSNSDFQQTFNDVFEAEVSGIYGEKEADIIFNHTHPQWTGDHPEPKVIKAISDAVQIADPTSNPLSIVSKIFLSESNYLKEGTYRRKKKHIDEFIKWSGNPDITKVTKKIAGNYMTFINQRAELAPATQRNKKNDVGSLFNWAEGRGYIEDNPFRKIRITNTLKQNRDSRTPWSNDEIIQFLSNKKIKINDFSATVIALYTGMRIEEICLIKRKDIEGECIKILKGKTKASSRTIPISGSIQPIMNRLCSRSGKDYLLLGLKTGGYDNKRSAYFSKRQTRLRKEVGLPEGVVFHSLRNTFATRLENLGVPKNHISQLLGHEDGNMALDVYSDGLAIEPLRKSISKLNYGDLVEKFIQSKFHELFQIK